MQSKVNKIVDKVEKKLKTIKVVEEEFENIPEELLQELQKEEQEFEKEEPKSKDCKLEIEVAKDYMLAYGTFYPASGEGKQFDMAYVMRTIKNEGIIKGIDESQIFKTIQEVNRTKISKKIIIARARLPEKGKDAEIELKIKFPIEEKRKLHFNDNYKQILSGAKVFPNDIIAIKHLQTAGKDGYKITGEILKAEAGKNVQCKAGRNIRIVEESGIIKFISTIKGVAYLEDGQLLKVKPYQDGSYSIDVSKDNMKVFLTIIPPFGGGKVIESKEVIEELKYLGINFEETKIKEIRELIHSSLAEEKIIENYIIAQGEMPENGNDAYLEFKVETSPEKKLKELADGRIDFRDFNKINTVQKGQIIAEKVKATIGKRDGKDVYGNIIKAKDGIDRISIELGENVLVSEDETKYIADISGCVKYKFGKLWVDPVYHVNGDLDFSVGNIDFNGDVIVSGDVLDGFRISATGNIIVYKNIGAAYILCGGNLIVKGGIINRYKGKIEVKSNLEAKFIENSKLEVEGDIFVREAILNSFVITNGIITLSEKGKGQLLGGTAIASKGVKAKTIGSESEIQTNIFIGHNIIIQNKLKELEMKVHKLEKEIQKVTKILNMLAKITPNRDDLTDKMKSMYKNAVKKKIFLKYELLKTFQEKEVLFSQQGYTNCDGKILVKDTIYPNVNITFRNKSLKVQNKINYATLKLNEDNKIDIDIYENRL